jgi:hypothetical protein
MSKSKALVIKPVSLPAVTDTTSPLVDELVGALGLPREILASNDDIKNAWQ